VIADSQRPVALAGIIGGENSEITDTTSDVLVEAAYFEPQVVYKTAKRLGLMTEAANRFWRGTDIDGLSAANDRVCGLLAEWGGGKVCRGTIDVYPRRRPAVEISLRPKRLADYLGVTIGVEDVAKYLTALELTVKGRTDQALTFGIPTFRMDLVAEVDLIEEVARSYGYANIPERLPEAGGPYVPVGGDAMDFRLLRDMLASLGLSEAINYSFVDGIDEALFRPAGIEEALKLANPMSETENTMRTSLLPGLMRNAARNVSRQQYDVRLFELGRVFRPRRADERGSDARDNKLPIEEQRISAVMYGPASPFGWGTPTRDVDFFDMKRMTEAVLDLAGVRAEYQPANVPSFLHPGASARLVMGDREYGWIGQIHPATLQALGLSGLFFAAEMDLALFQHELRAVRYSHLPRFPGVRRDVALLAKDSVRAGALIDFTRTQAKAKAPALEQVQLFDVYQGKPIPKGHASLAFAFFFRDQERTLTDEEVQGQFDAIVAGLRSEFGVEVREG